MVYYQAQLLIPTALLVAFVFHLLTGDRAVGMSGKIINLLRMDCSFIPVIFRLWQVVATYMWRGQE
jgi:hypothetical protein